MILRIWLVASALLVTTAQAQSTLHLVDKAYPDARVVNIDRDGKLVFGAAAESRQFDLPQVVRWCSPKPVSPSTALAMLDGSWLSGQLQWQSENRLRVTSQWFEPVEVDLEQVRALIINASPSWPETQQLQRQLLSPTGAQDVLWKRGNESAAGVVSIQIKKSLERGESDRAVLRFKRQDANTSIEVPQSDLVGVTFSPVLRDLVAETSTGAVLTMIDGSRLRVKEVKKLGNGQVECLLQSGQKLISLDEADAFVESLAAIHAQPGNITWLSDLEPARYRLLESDSQVPWPLGRDRDLLGKRLFDTQGHALDHCLVMHSPAQVAYRPDPKAKRLLATVEIIRQPESGSPVQPLGSAACQVMVGRSGQLVKVWESPIIRVGDLPLNVDADISNAQLVVLLVDQADLGTLGDHILWRDARLVTESTAGGSPLPP